MGVKVREKPRGSGIFWIFINHQGKRKSKKIGKDKRLANEVAKKIEAKLTLGDLGVINEDNVKIPTLGEYIFGWEDNEGYHAGWLNTVAKLSLKSSTRLGYKHIIKNHVVPAFGSKAINEINPRMIDNFIYKLFNKGLRSSTNKNIKNCLSAILRHAYKHGGYIESNPARGIEIPRPEDEKAARVPDPLTWNERDVLESVFRERFPRYSPLVICGFRTGLRIGELIALKWEDVDFYNRLIMVQRNITRGKITTPKSRAGTRHVRMTSYLIEVLKEKRKQVKEEKLRKGWNELPEWVFCNEDGGFINYGNFIHRIWNRAMEKSELRRRTPHDMRHTYATLRLSKGDSLAEVSKEMGHGAPDITYRTYYKWLPKESRSNIDELDGVLENDAPKRTLSAP
jgi:integrase